MGIRGRKKRRKRWSSRRSQRSRRRRSARRRGREEEDDEREEVEEGYEAKKEGAMEDRSAKILGREDLQWFFKTASCLAMFCCAMCSPGGGRTN